MVSIATAATAFSAWLVRRFMPTAAGSGIPHVEAVIEGQLPPAPFALLPVKFVGGLLAIGSGLALGREGPCVQMGATLAHRMGKLFGRDEADGRSLLAAGAGAGARRRLQCAARGSAFVLEELIKKFEMRNAVRRSALRPARSSSPASSPGRSPTFFVASLPYPDAGDNLLCLALGVIAGLLGVVYNRTLLGALALADRLANWPVRNSRCTDWGGGGGAGMVRARTRRGRRRDHANDAHRRRTACSAPLVFSAAAGSGVGVIRRRTPGGLFAPLLVLGAQMGFFFGALCHPDPGSSTTHAIMFAVVGMAAFFTAVVRAPLTGIILVTEMTANSRLLLPMLAACFSAMALATMLGEPPLYDSLKERASRGS